LEDHRLRFRRPGICDRQRSLVALSLRALPLSTTFAKAGREGIAALRALHVDRHYNCASIAASLLRQLSRTGNEVQGAHIKID